MACVGGSPLSADDSRFARAFTLARASRFGVGGSVYAAPDRLVETDTVPWGMYRREALVDAGGFDPRMQHGEDEELNWRIRRSGGRILHNPQIRFRYVPRSSFGGVFRQYRDYGRARVRVVKEHPNFLRARHLAPAAMVAGATVLAAAAPFSRNARAGLAGALGAYASAATLFALDAARRDDITLAPLVAACFPALHGGYGAGTLRGIASTFTRCRFRPRLAPYPPVHMTEPAQQVDLHVVHRALRRRWRLIALITIAVCGPGAGRLAGPAGPLRGLRGPALPRGGPDPEHRSEPSPCPTAARSPSGSRRPTWRWRRSTGSRRVWRASSIWI